TRQNDLDVGFTISIQPGGYTNRSLLQGAQATQENRQAFFTFGDKSWGSIKLGKDLGIFASDAILNDMTLLGVGNGAYGKGGAITTTTLGGIGAGYIYADWKEQISYTTPNMNGFQATVAVTQGWNATGAFGTTTGIGLGSVSQGGSQPAFEGKASYDFSTDAVKGKVWVSAVSQKIQNIGAGLTSKTGNAEDIGVTISAAGFGLTGYYYNGQGAGTTGLLLGALSATGEKRDSDGGYVQATYVLPTATKIGVAYGVSNLDAATGDVTFKGTKNERWTVGAYHPLTKHVNLVAEYDNAKTQPTGAASSTTNTVSLGGILFF
ncbi:MAG: porin, partial [Verrucomicrobiota bacterium]